MELKILNIEETENRIIVSVDLNNKPRRFSFPITYLDEYQETGKPQWLHKIKEYTERSQKKEQKKLKNKYVGKIIDLSQVEDMSSEAISKRWQERDLKTPQQRDTSNDKPIERKDNQPAVILKNKSMRLKR